MPGGGSAAGLYNVSEERERWRGGEHTDEMRNMARRLLVRLAISRGRSRVDTFVVMVMSVVWGVSGAGVADRAIELQSPVLSETGG